MKEIRFRSWDGERLRKVNTIGWVDGDVDFVTTPRYSGPAEDFRLMQYTGLKDKNGIEIYEGDALRDSESIVIVKFVDGEFSVDYRTMGGKWRNYGSLFDYLKDYEGEVIGNIYENQELLERGAE